MSAHGTVRVGEVTLAIDALRLAAGEFVIDCSAPGPLAKTSGPVRVFGPDGFALTDTRNQGRITLPRIKRREVLRIKFSFAVNSITGPSEVAWS